MPPDGDATTLVISGIWVNQEEDWITKQSKNQPKHLIHNILKDIVLVLTVLSLVTWVQDCGWHMRDKILCQRGPFVEFSHEDLIIKLMVSIFQYSSMRNLLKFGIFKMKIMK